MKQKDNSINVNNAYWFKKGLIILILLLFINNTFAQKIFEKSINSIATKIVVDFSIIDQVELTTWEKENKIIVIAKSEENNIPDILLEVRDNIVFIKSVDVYFEQESLEIDKQCSIQPIYTTYHIKIPENKKVDISFTQGNFYANNFKGDLNLKVEEGIIKINHFEGLVNVQINTGNVYFNEIKNIKIDVVSNLGLVSSNLLMENKNQSKNHLKGVFGENFNELNVKAIMANIQLKSSKN